MTTCYITKPTCRKRLMNKALILVLLLIIVSFSCLVTACVSSSSKIDEAEEFADIFIDYALEVKLADEIATGRLNNATELLQTGEITTFEFRKRCYQIYLIHAYTLEYIDSKPEYKILFPLLYGQEEPAKLDWCIPELEGDVEGVETSYESHLREYIDYHHEALAEILEEVGPPKSG